MQNSTTGNSLTKFFWNLSKLTLIVSVLWGMFVPVHANPDDNSLEYFLTHARALVHDVRENLLTKTDPSATYLIAYEQELEIKLNMLRGLKYNATQEVPKDSANLGSAYAVAPKDTIIWSVMTNDHKIWGLKVEGQSISKVFPFTDVLSCPFNAGDGRRTFYFENLVRAHSYGLNERAVKGYLPEGTPFDPQMAQSISQFLLQVKELEPFWKRQPSRAHPSVQFCDRMIRHLIPNFRYSFDDAYGEMSRIREYYGKDIGEDLNLMGNKESIRRMFEANKAAWNQFFSWVNLRLDRIPTGQSNNDDGDEEPTLQVQYGERFRRLLKIHPIHENFKLYSPPESAEW